MCFKTTFGTNYLAGAILRGLKCVDSTHYGYGLNFQLIQLEAFIQAFSNKPLRLHKGKGSAYHQPLSTLRYIDRRRVCFLATLCAADRLVLYTAILKGSKNPFKTTSSFLSRSTIVIMTIV